MNFRLTASTGLALLLLSGTAVMANSGAHGFAHELPVKSPVEPIGLFGLFGGDETQDKTGSDVQIAQADPRVTELEEQIRKLSGTIEELNFQILQMQDQMRKMQEDNEFRFQELEKGGGSTTKSKSGSLTPPAQADTATPEPPAAADTAPVQQPPATQSAEGSDNGDNGVPGVNLGTLTVDQNGNIQSSTATAPTDLLGGQGGTTPSDGTTVAAVPSADDPDELYRNSYEFILSGDYPSAEAGFRDHIERFPADPRAADAHYWLGEALLGQQKYRDAAETFLESSKDYSSSGKAPDMLLKLGVSLKALNQHDVACATFKEVTKRYPKASDALKQRVKQEQALAAC